MPTAGVIIVVLIAIGVIGAVIYFLKKQNEEDEEDNVVVDSDSGSVEIDTGSGGDVIITPGIPGSRDPIKKALIVGINIYKPELDANLRGCVNDAEAMRSILVDIFKFNPDNVRLILDDRATKASMIERLAWLINGCIPGDELVFHYSGHGSQVRDRHGDELEDGLDEILCPHDLDWDDPLTDDYLGQIFSTIPEGVYFTMICDACHSGTITKDLICSNNPKRAVARFILPPYDIRSRSLGQELTKSRMARAVEGVQNHVLLSGCEDDQTSADAFIDGKYQGAMTWAFTSSVIANPDITWLEAHNAVLSKLANEFTQRPRLSGESSLLTRRIFGGRQ